MYVLIYSKLDVVYLQYYMYVFLYSQISRRNDMNKYQFDSVLLVAHYTRVNVSGI